MHQEYAALRRFMEDNVPFHTFLGLQVVRMAKGEAEIMLPYRDDFLGDVRRPALHGGIISTLIDSCGGLAAWSYCTARDKIATVDMRVDYLLPAPPRNLHAASRVERLGNRVAVVSTEVFAEGVKDKDRKIIAAGRAVYNIRRALEQGL